ncbi:MAG TPA: YciI family protein [Bacteroidia bacterium]|jgi:uncharacterized protein YciI|nr:YciI family protein [Bacteroidia bacterium]
MRKFLIAFLVCITTVAFAQERPSEKKYEMKTYYLVFLKKGPNQDQDSTTLRKLQEGHMTHLNKMADAGKMDLAGPIMSKGELRGICVYNVPTKEEAEKLVNEDPMVKAGRLIAEILPWYSAKGASLK